MAFKWSFVIFCSLAAVKAQNGYSRDNPSNRLTYDQNYESQAYNDEMLGGEIPGEAGKDYPIFSELPETRFECKQQQFPGYYADPEAMCQVYHICQNGGRVDSFLCPNGTIFNQEKLVCDWWFNFECAQTQSYYAVNEAIVMAMEEAERLSAAKISSDGYRYNMPQGQNKYQRPSVSGASDFDTVVVGGVSNGQYSTQRGPAPSNQYSAPQGGNKYQGSGFSGSPDFDAVAVEAAPSRGLAPSGQYFAPGGPVPSGQYSAQRRPAQGYSATNRGPLQGAFDSFRHPAPQTFVFNPQEPNAYNPSEKYEITGASFERKTEEPQREYLPAQV